MRKRSKSPAAAADLARAEEVLERRKDQPGQGHTFRGVKHALGWFYETRGAMQSPKGLHLRTAQSYYGQTVVVECVDGGRGGDIDDTLATLVTIAQCVDALWGYDRLAHRVVVRRHGSGWTQQECAAELQVSQGQISIKQAVGEAYLAGLLRQEGVLV